MNLGSTKFGTDGIRGRAGVEITDELARSVGNAVSHVVGSPVWVARDPRPSSPALAAAVLAGIVDAGGEAVDLGVLPTPGLSWRVAREAGGPGVMVTASHNPIDDNGLKVVFGNGKKLSANVLSAISGQLGQTVSRPGGTRRQVEDATAAYVSSVLDALPPGKWLTGKRILFDGAMGAAAEAGRLLLESLGAAVVPFRGQAINDQCGAVHPQFAAAGVVKMGCDAGLAVDGDGDRVALIDRNGRLLDGDAILWLLRSGPVVVGTIMSNLGLERALEQSGIQLVRTGVGDALVAAKMHEIGAQVGGEPSGHILLQNGCPTSDGLHVGLLALSRDISLSTVGFEPYPQAHASLRDVVSAEVDTRFVSAAGGRAVVRKSGTEPVVRVMVEHPDVTTANELRDRLVAILQEYSA